MPRAHADLEGEDLGREMPVLVHVAQERPEVGDGIGDGLGMVGIRLPAGQGILEAAAGGPLPLAEPLPEEPVEPPDDALAHGRPVVHPDAVIVVRGVGPERGERPRQLLPEAAGLRLAEVHGDLRERHRCARRIGRPADGDGLAEVRPVLDPVEVHAQRGQQARVHAAVLDERQQGAHQLARGCGQAAVRRGVVHVQDHDRSRRAMISRIISDVPEAMGHRRTSRKKRSTGSSRM